MKIIFILLVLLFVGCGSNSPKYVKGIVIDPRTKLMWQDNLASEVDTMNWDKAIKYCNDLNLANFQDWELPSKDLLVTAYKTKNIFYYIASSDYWSSSSYTNDSESNLAWDVRFTDGHTGYNSKINSNYVRCVRNRP